METINQDAFAQFAEGWDEIPEDTMPVRPKVWVEAEVVEAETVENEKFNYPQIALTMKIHASGSDEEGKKASGVLRDWLSKPSRGHTGMSEKRVMFMQQMFRKALVAMLAPDAENKTVADKICVEKAAAAGGFPQALIGRRVLAKIGLNDGRDKTGAIVSEMRSEKPVNRIDDYKPLNEGNAKKYLT